MHPPTSLRPAPAPRINPKCFPTSFCGDAPPPHQVEGNNASTDHWVIEHLPESMFKEPSGDACDHYHLYPQDIGMLADLGFNTYRFSMESARIEPEEGFFSHAELEHYRRMLATCREHNLTTLLTYSHFSMPRWFAYKGAWQIPQPRIFMRASAKKPPGTWVTWWDMRPHSTSLMFLNS